MDYPCHIQKRVFLRMIKFIKEEKLCFISFYIRDKIGFTMGLQNWGFILFHFLK